MIKSMTGYGRAQGQAAGFGISVEIKSVNHRYFEFSSKVYRNYSFIEERLKAYVQSRVSRGKTECFVQIDALEADEVLVQINHSLAGGYVNAFKELSESYGLSNDVSASLIARQSDVIQLRKAPADEEAVWEAVLSVLEPAVDAFLEMRGAEGQRLKEDILGRAEVILSHVDFIEKRSPETVREYNEKLISRMGELLADKTIDEQRLLTEAAIFADKIAVAEEVTRLRSHISQLREFLESGESVGKTLDFLVQEINREINTVGSKASDIEIARAVIAVKTEVEKIREQVQNIE